MTPLRRASISDVKRQYRRAYCETCRGEQWFRYDTGHWVCEACKFVKMRRGAPERVWVGG